MRFRMRTLLLVAFLVVCGPATATAQQKSPREAYAALNGLRVDAARVYYVRDLTLRRDAVRMLLTEGKLAFLESFEGRTLGAVFTGRGQILAAPRDPIERRSLAHFLDAPLLDQFFTRAYMRFTDTTADELRRQLATAGTVPIAEPGFAEEWNGVVGNLNIAHSQRALADWLAAAPRPYFYAGLLGEKSGPFDVLLDERRADYLLLGQPKWSDGARYYDVWAAFPRSQAEPWTAPFSASAYEVDTVIAADHALQGTTVARVVARVAGERTLALELSRNLTVEEVSDNAGRQLVFFQNEEMSRQEASQRGNDSLLVILPEATTAGQELRLTLRYGGTVISDAGNGVLFVGERGSWYPHLGGADQFAAFDLKFRWPRKLVLVATGRKQSEAENGEWKSGRWVSEQPYPVAGFNLGDYRQHRLESGKVVIDLYANEDLEAAVLNRFVRNTLPPSMPRSPVVGTRLQQPMPRLALPDAPPPSPAAVMKEVGQNIAEAVKFNEKFSGPFPFERLSVAQIPGSFGQGWPGLLYLSTLSFLSPSQQTRAGIGQRTQDQFLDLIPPHEVAHQWWGSVVGWSSYRDQWIAEGLANYIALLYADSKQPNEGVLEQWLDQYRKELLLSEDDGETISDDAGPLVLGTRLRSSKSPTGYTRIVYGKGAWVFHMLRSMLRDPRAKEPDARFVQMLSGLLADYRYRALTTDGLQKAVEKVMTPAMALEAPRNMDWFFDQYVRGTGIPRYEVSFVARPLPNGTFQIRGKLMQKGVPESFVAPVPVYAPRAGGKPVLLGTVVTSGAETTFTFTSRTAPRKLLIDPALTLLAASE
jgi:hypothetical protein